LKRLYSNPNIPSTGEKLLNLRETSQINRVEQNLNAIMSSNVKLLDWRFLQVLRCTLTSLTFSQVPLETLWKLGVTAQQTLGWESALLREDRKVAYPVRAGVPVLLAEEAQLVD
jgi:uncharacterized protein YbaR (Trm112 family)